MMFASREDAGRRLGHFLVELGAKADLVLGLPRGGVIVAAETARLLQVPLSVLVVRKIGHPLHREFAVGALAEHDVVVLDDESIGQNPAVRGQVAEVIEEEKRRLAQYSLKFHQPRQFPLSGKAVVIVDDGLATGATMEAAVLSAQKQCAAAVAVAVPVASSSAMDRLRHVAGQVYAIHVDPDFDAVGRYYVVFGQTTDEQVLEALLRQTIGEK